MKRFASFVVTLLAIVWASPWSLLGVLVGVGTLVSGGKMHRQGRVLAFYGGFARWVLERTPNGQFVLAMTLGHTILAKNEDALEISREHEMVHVRQYERWGVLFVPAYLLSSLVLWFAGKDAYRDNPFEREAYGDTE